jgi:glycyl-tRNA synthetase alpha subunit
MDKDQLNYFKEVNEAMKKVNDITVKYGYEDSVMYIGVVGMIMDFNDENVSMQSSIVYSIESEEEIDLLTEVLKNAHEEQKKNDKDIDDLLNGLNISAN